MTDPLVDAQALIHGLQEYEVDYLLFGAIAMLFYGYVRTTEDIDIIVNPDGANLDRLAEWLMSLKAVLKLNPKRRFGPRERWGLHKGSNATVLTSWGRSTLCSGCQAFRTGRSWSTRPRCTRSSGGRCRCSIAGR